MPIYFYVIPGETFHDELVRDLAASWQGKSFEPCRALCRRYAAGGRFAALRDTLSSDKLLVERVAEGLSFDRLFWPQLVAELLMFSASEVPDFQTSPDALVRLLSPAAGDDCSRPRDRLPIEQA